MTYEQMSNFTYEELSHFSHLELSLESTELMINLINDFREDIPSGIILKLEGISKNFLNSCERNNVEIPSEIAELKNKKHLTIIDIISILDTIVSIISFVMSLFSSGDKTVNNTYINQVTNYVINEEYITNIDTTYNELKQIYNISINTDENSNDSNTEYWFHYYINCI